MPPLIKNPLNVLTDLLDFYFYTPHSLLDCYAPLLTKTNCSSRSSPLPWINPNILNLKSARRHLERIYGRVQQACLADVFVKRFEHTEVLHGILLNNKCFFDVLQYAGLMLLVFLLEVGSGILAYFYEMAVCTDA